MRERKKPLKKVFFSLVILVFQNFFTVLPKSDCHLEKYKPKNWYKNMATHKTVFKKNDVGVADYLYSTHPFAIKRAAGVKFFEKIFLSWGKFGHEI